MRDFQRRFWGTLPLTAVVFVLAMFGHRMQWVDMAVQSWVELVLPTLAPQVFHASFVLMGRVAVYFEAAVVIISLTLFGQILELRARSQTLAAIKSLLKLPPKQHGALGLMAPRKTSH